MTRMRAALAKPVMRFTIGIKLRDAAGEEAGFQRRELVLAPASDSPQNRIFYGRISGEALPFLVNADTVARLAVDLFGDD